MDIKVKVKINKSIRDIKPLIDKARYQGLLASAMLVEKDAKIECPVDTGRLKGSITYEVKPDVATVGTNVEYAKHVEYGTKFMQGHPYLRPALDKNIIKIKNIFKNLLAKVGE